MSMPFSFSCKLLSRHRFTSKPRSFHAIQYLRCGERCFVAIPKPQLAKHAKAALLFPGQGAQYVGMANDIYSKYKVAQRVFEEAEEALGFGLRKIMFEGPQDKLTLTENAQPAILCHSIAILRVLEEEYGLKVKSFTFAMGHSLGEYSALVATQSLSLSDAVKLVRLRGQAMQESVSVAQTAMRAIVIHGEHLEDIENLLPKIQRSLPEGEICEIANINSRSQVVLSGTKAGVEYASSIFSTKGYAGRGVSLPVSAPFHCSLMSSAQEKMRSALVKTPFKEPIIDVISNVTGQAVKNPSHIGELLCKQITKTVQWQRSIQYAIDDDVHDWVVLGPSRVLANLLRKEHPNESIMSINTADEIPNYKQK